MSCESDGSCLPDHVRVKELTYGARDPKRLKPNLCSQHRLLDDALMKNVRRGGVVRFDGGRWVHAATEMDRPGTFRVLIVAPNGLAAYVCRQTLVENPPLPILITL